MKIKRELKIKGEKAYWISTILGGSKVGLIKSKFAGMAKDFKTSKAKPETKVEEGAAPKGVASKISNRGSNKWLKTKI